MINYILLVSRQGGSLTFFRCLDRTSERTTCRQSSSGEMVHYYAPKSQGEDREGRYTAGSCAADADVQLS